jgi:hypothetical protein
VAPTRIGPSEIMSKELDAALTAAVRQSGSEEIKALEADLSSPTADRIAHELYLGLAGVAGYEPLNLLAVADQSVELEVIFASGLKTGLLVGLIAARHLKGH